jgi:hypothetical protein
MLHRTLKWLLTALALAAVAGCGSSSGGGIGSESPQTILKSSLAAADSLKSVHAAGAIVSGGQHIAIDIQLLNGVGGEGQITLSGLTFRLIGLRNYAYLLAPPAIWRQAGAPAAAAQLLQGKWLRTPATGQFASISKLTEIHQLFSGLLAPHGQLNTGPVSTVAGHKVVAVRGGNGTLYVAATGPPYPIQVSKTGSDGGQLTFDRFNEALTLSAPKNTIDLPQLAG